LSRFTVGRAIFVTKPQTRRRTCATIPVQWPEIDAIVTAPATSYDRQPTSGHGLADLIDEMVGDLFRIKDYPNRGWQVPQDIPRKVEDAYRFLVRAGFHPSHSRGVVGRAALRVGAEVERPPERRPNADGAQIHRSSGPS
jgi:hypothetical protein